MKIAPEQAFEHDAQFHRGEDGGGLRLGRLELMYEELFAEVIEDGIITADERRRLDTMANNFGLDRERLRRLEAALQAAYGARHQLQIVEASGEGVASTSLAQVPETAAPQTQMLQQRIVHLEARIRELEVLLADADLHVNVEVDLAGFGTSAGASTASTASTASSGADVASLARVLRQDPRDEESLHALFAALSDESERRFGVAQVLQYIGKAEPAELAFYERHRTHGLIRPTHSLSQDAWSRLLIHPEQEAVVGEIFSVVVSAVLLGRVSALRRDKSLPILDAAHKQNPTTTTLQSVRCMHWASAILGLQMPDTYVDPGSTRALELVPGIPPASRLGAPALAGRSAPELAFLAGRHLAHFRQEHFVKLVVPGVRGLEDVFLASLSIGNPALPLNAQTKQLVMPIAKAIEPILEADQVDRLRGSFLRFVEEGGRTNLQRWSVAVERTCNRAGFLLCGDLHAAEAVLKLDDEAAWQTGIDDLLCFLVSERYGKLRKQLGVAVL
jgi:hypothetical protein